MFFKQICHVISSPEAWNYKDAKSKMVHVDTVPPGVVYVTGPSFLHLTLAAWCSGVIWIVSSSPDQEPGAMPTTWHQLAIVLHQDKPGQFTFQVREVKFGLRFDEFVIRNCAIEGVRAKGE